MVIRRHRLLSLPERNPSKAEYEPNPDKIS
jgi:hypothetical protein